MIDGDTLVVRPLEATARPAQSPISSCTGEAMQAILGTPGTVLMAVAIMISTFGCNNGLILSGARVYYAMARDGVFFQRVGSLNSRQVPAVALMLQANPDLTTAFRGLNRLFNIGAYNPGGSEGISENCETKGACTRAERARNEGGLYWLAWGRDGILLRVTTDGDTWKVVRTMMGVTDPKEAAPGTIRGDFGTLVTPVEAE